MQKHQQDARCNYFTLIETGAICRTYSSCDIDYEVGSAKSTSLFSIHPIYFSSAVAMSGKYVHFNNINDWAEWNFRSETVLFPHTISLRIRYICSESGCGSIRFIFNGEAIYDLDLVHAENWAFSEVVEASIVQGIDHSLVWLTQRR